MLIHFTMGMEDCKIRNFEYKKTWSQYISSNKWGRGNTLLMYVHLGLENKSITLKTGDQNQ